ncbi:MAG: M48 family metallopeptidase [Clostridia bacterium]|nr:M48 family metallopeptidase [Clostridia bacterium]
MITPDKIVYSNRKSLAVCVDHFGKVTVRAPRKTGEKHIFAFLTEKEDWIRKKQAQYAAVSVALPTETLDGYTFLLLGNPCTVRLYDGKKIAFQNGEVFLPKENARKRLVKWLKENAKRIFTAVTAQKAAEMGVTYKSVSISGAKTRWGTCSADNKIRYTFRLLYTSKDLIEYVVVHELAHVRHKDHSKAFWQEVERYVPDWKSRRKRLKERGALMEIF